MKIESLREVKANLSKIVKTLASERSVVITKNGRPVQFYFQSQKTRTSKACCSHSGKTFGNLSIVPTKRVKRKGSRSSKISLTDRC
jgi:hypothetical protein